MRWFCYLRKCLILVENGTEFILLFSFTWRIALFDHVVNVSSSFPPMRMQIEVWAVSNLTFVLLSFTILNLTIEVPLKVLALYSLRYGTLKNGNGEAMPYTTFVPIKIYSVV